MVNIGKPSGGCKLCRARRIKCDEAKPFCMKCQKAKRQCPGYRDPFDGKIRDETQATIRKFKKTRIVIEKHQVLAEERENEENVKADVENWKSGYFDKNERNAATADISPRSAKSSSSWETAPRELFVSLVTPVEQQATCYLLSDYILTSDSSGIKRGHYKFVYKILTRNTPSSCLSSAFRALSLVALASRPNSRHLMLTAEFHYSKALREVNKAIQDSEQVKSDHTLASVLLLAFYETLASTRERLDEYMSHIQGAAQLVKMRGPNQMNTDEGAEMFAMTRNQVLGARLMGGSGLMDGDYSWLLHQQCQDKYVSRVATLTIACSEVRMKADMLLTGGQRDPQKIAAVLTLLRTAQGISKKVAVLDRPQNAFWAIDIAESSADAPPDGGPVYSFHSLYTCMIYTIIWISHLSLCTSILRCMAWLVDPDDYKSGEDYEDVVVIIKKLIEDIVAATPYCCTWNGYKGTGFSSFPCGERSPVAPSKGIAGMCIFRPAFNAMVSDYATPEQKKFLEERLKFLADIVGIKQANVLLKIRDESASPSKDIERDRARI